MNSTIQILLDLKHLLLSNNQAVNAYKFKIKACSLHTRYAYAKGYVETEKRMSQRGHIVFCFPNS